MDIPQGRQPTSMVLTPPRSERYPRVLAVPSSGHSGLGDVVLVNLLVHKKEEQAHELRDSEV